MKGESTERSGTNPDDSGGWRKQKETPSQGFGFK